MYWEGSKVDFPIPRATEIQIRIGSEGGFNTSRVLVEYRHSQISDPHSLDQEILPCGQGRIYIVKINPSLLMMRGCIERAFGDCEVEMKREF